jgi:hypothetical protein
MDFIEPKENIDKAGSGLHLYSEIVFRKNTRFVAAFAFRRPAFATNSAIQTTHCLAQNRNASA